MMGSKGEEEAKLLMLPDSTFINLTKLREAKLLEERRFRKKTESAITGKVAALKNWLWRSLMTIAMKIYREYIQNISIKLQRDKTGKPKPLT